MCLHQHVYSPPCQVPQIQATDYLHSIYISLGIHTAYMGLYRHCKYRGGFLDVLDLYCCDELHHQKQPGIENLAYIS